MQVRRILLAILAFGLLAVAACNPLQTPQKPSAPAASQPPEQAKPGAPPPASGSTPANPTPPFTPYWVKNHRITDMWSGPLGAVGVSSFGKTSKQFCSFRVDRPQDNARLYLWNPYSDNYLWIVFDILVWPTSMLGNGPPVMA